VQTYNTTRKHELTCFVPGQVVIQLVARLNYYYLLYTMQVKERKE